MNLPLLSPNGFDSWNDCGHHYNFVDELIKLCEQVSVGWLVPDFPVSGLVLTVQNSVDPEDWNDFLSFSLDVLLKVVKCVLHGAGQSLLKFLVELADK